MLVMDYHTPLRGGTDVAPLQQKPISSTRDKVVEELLETERRYMQDMERLENYMNELRKRKIVPAAIISGLFGNFPDLIEFQRKFSTQLWAMAAKTADEQRLGELFMKMENDFRVYESYCANFYSAQDLVIQQKKNLEVLSSMINPVYELPSMLIKPVQRICKYPLLLSELIKSTNARSPYLAEMQHGHEAIKRVAGRVNETQRRHENTEAVHDLKKRLSDDESSTIEEHDDLLIYGKIVMLRNDNERELQLYFFEKALLVFKENKDSARNRLAKSSTLSLRRKRRNSLQAKSKILSSKLVATLNRSEIRSENRKWLLEVQYRGEKGMEEQFLLRFPNHEKLRLWEEVFKRVIRRNKYSRQIPISRSCSHIVRSSVSDDDEGLSDASSIRSKKTSNSSFDHMRYPISPPPSHPTSPVVKSIRQGPPSRQNNYGVHQRKINGMDQVDTTARPSLGRLQSHSTTGFGLSRRPRVSDQSTLLRSRSQSSPNIHGNVARDEVRPPACLKIKVRFDDAIYVIVVPQDISFFDLTERVEKKTGSVLNIQSNSLSLKYKDEDGDLITISSDDDVTMAFESKCGPNTVALFVTP